jgi:hypothetical protein
MILSPFQLAHYFHKDLIYILMNANDDLEFFMAIELGLFKKSNMITTLLLHLLLTHKSLSFYASLILI